MYRVLGRRARYIPRSTPLKWDMLGILLKELGQCTGSERAKRLCGSGFQEEPMKNFLEIARQSLKVINAREISTYEEQSNAFVREFVAFSTSTILSSGTRFVVNLVAARVLGPAQFGIWNTLNLILLYGPVLLLGVPNGMNRDVPLFRGRGDMAGVARIRSATLGFAIVASVVVGCLIVATSGYFSPAGEWVLPLQSTAVLFFASQVYNYWQMYLKSDARFSEMSKQQVWYSLLFPATVIPMLLWLGLTGYVLGQAITALLVSLLIVSSMRLRPVLSIDWQEVWRLARAGFPIMAVGLLHSLLTTVDRWVILTFLNVEQLGFYSLVIIITSTLMLLPTVVAQQVYPRMAETYGRTNAVSSLTRLVRLQVICAGMITVPVVLVIFLALPWFVNAFLPAYVPGIDAARVALLGLFFLPLSGGFGNMLNTLGKQVYYMLVQGLAVMVNLGLSVLLVRLGQGITGVATATAASYVVFSVGAAVVGIAVARRGVSC